MDNRRHIVVTGASSGIGAALTKSLASDGFALYVCARRSEKLCEVKKVNSTIFAYPCDVSDEEQVEAFVAQISALTPHVDMLINCAAIQGAIGPTIEIESRNWYRALEVNLLGTYLMIKYVAPMMKAERKPRIINFSGGGAFNPVPQYSAYAVSKAAVVRLTENLALELASKSIMVNAVAPGFVDTEIHQETLRAGPELAGRDHFETTQRRLREDSVPIEVPVACVRFLLSDQADDLTGKTISASFDPWDTPEFVDHIPLINKSDLYTMQRIDLVNLPEGQWKGTLTSAAGRGNL